MRVGVEPGQPDDRAAGIGPPVRREQPGERRHEVHAAVVVDLAGQRLALRGAADDAQLVAQPLHGRAGDGDRTLKRVNGFGVAELVAHRGQQAVLRAHDLLAGVEQQEIAGAVGVLGLAGVQAHLPDHRGLLVAEDAGHRHLPAERPVVAGDAVGLRERRRLDLGQHLPRNAEERQQFVVPVQRLQVHQHGPAGVGDVGDVHAAARPAGEVPQHPGVGGAEDRVALLGVASRTPSTFSRIHCTLPPEK